MINTDLAYIAAFVDGEGTIIARKYVRVDGGTTLYPRLAAYNQDKAPLEFIVDVFGGKLYLTKTVYQWWCPQKTVISKLKLIRPYMRVKHKIERADLFIDNESNLDSIGDEWDSLLSKQKSWQSTWHPKEH